MAVIRFNYNVTKNLESVLSYCLKNQIDSYVDFDAHGLYTVKIDLTPLVDKKARDLLKFLNDMKKKTK